MEGQMSLLEPGLQLNRNCETCACGCRTSFFNKRIPCLWSQLPDQPCPEAVKRNDDDNPVKWMGSCFRYTESWCIGCHYNKPIKFIDGRPVYGDKDNWTDYDNHRFMCPSYVPDNHKDERCIGMVIDSWKLPDGRTVKWCPECDANGCDDCYKEFEKRFEDEE